MNSSSLSCQWRSADLELALMRETLTPNCVSPTASPSFCFSRPAMTDANSFGYDGLLANEILERSIFGIGSGLPHRIGLAGLLHIALAGLVAHGAHVDVGIHGRFIRSARTDLDVNGVFLRAIDQAMTDTAIRLPAGGVARFHHSLAVVLDERDLAFEHIDEFVLVPVPVPLRRPGAGLERDQVNSKLVESHDVAEALAFAADDRFPERLGIHADGIDRDFGDIDPRHCRHTRSMIVAVPIPTPMHNVTSAVERLRRSSSSSTVPRIIAPVAPSGWPMAMAPPLTLILS